MLTNHVKIFLLEDLMDKFFYKLIRLLSNKPERRVVYTCMFGYSENFSDRGYEHDGLTDYVCFTDDKMLKSKNWALEYIDSSKFGPVKTAKMVKILPHRFLGSYSASLYIDNTVRLKVSIKHMFSYLKTGNMVCFRHPLHSCIYEEAEKLVELRYDSAETIAAQVEAYQLAGFPAEAGLIFGAVLLRRHSDTQIRTLMEDWFKEVKRHSYRDQMSFNYVAWKLGFQPSYFDGNVYCNEIMDWPVVEGPRVPRGFRDDVYLGLNPDVALSGMNPRRHYLLFGAAEGRSWC